MEIEAAVQIQFDNKIHPHSFEIFNSIVQLASTKGLDIFPRYQKPLRIKDQKELGS